MHEKDTQIQITSTFLYRNICLKNMGFGIVGLANMLRKTCYSPARPVMTTLDQDGWDRGLLAQLSLSTAQLHLKLKTEFSKQNRILQVSPDCGRTVKHQVSKTWRTKHTHTHESRHTAKSSMQKPRWHRKLLVKPCSSAVGAQSQHTDQWMQWPFPQGNTCAAALRGRWLWQSAGHSKYCCVVLHNGYLHKKAHSLINDVGTLIFLEFRWQLTGSYMTTLW